MNSCRQFITFVFCGGVAACANLTSRLLFSLWLPYSAAIISAYLVGMFTGYLLFKIFTFNSRHSQRVLQETIWYILINALALTQTLIISLLLAHWFFPIIKMNFRPEEIAHLFGVAVPIVTSYY